MCEVVTYDRLNHDTRTSAFGVPTSGPRGPLGAPGYDAGVDAGHACSCHGNAPGSVFEITDMNEDQPHEGLWT
jgi:hypothetical protein